MYICSFCKQSYQSDGTRKPKSYHKDGTPYQYYDSKLFCSKECCIKNTSKKKSYTLKKIYKNNPEIIEKQRIKHKETLLLKSPEEKQKSIQKMLATRKAWPEDKKIEVRTKMSLKKQSMTTGEKQKRVSRFLESFSKVYKEHPEIWTQRLRKYKETFRNHPEIGKKISNSLKTTYQNHPEIHKKIQEKRKETFKNHPEIMEKAYDKAYQTLKEKGFISKEEQEMIRLLKEKFSEDDIIEQYRDPRYSKPGTKYKYSCDCYIKSLDLFIEFNGSRFHPKEEDRGKLEEELKRFKSKYPNRNIKECQAYQLLNTIETDKIKQKVAKDNNLNYLIVTDGFKELDNL